MVLASVMRVQERAKLRQSTCLPRLSGKPGEDARATLAQTTSSVNTDQSIPYNVFSVSTLLDLRIRSHRGLRATHLPPFLFFLLLALLPLPCPPPPPLLLFDGARGFDDPAAADDDEAGPSLPWVRVASSFFLAFNLLFSFSLSFAARTSAYPFLSRFGSHRSGSGPGRLSSGRAAMEGGSLTAFTLLVSLLDNDVFFDDLDFLLDPATVPAVRGAVLLDEEEEEAAAAGPTAAPCALALALVDMLATTTLVLFRVRYSGWAETRGAMGVASSTSTGGILVPSDDEDSSPRRDGIEAMKSVWATEADRLVCRSSRSGESWSDGSQG